MTDAYIQAQGDLAPVQSDDTAVVDSFFAAESGHQAAKHAPVQVIHDVAETEETTVIAEADLADDAAEPQEPKLPNGFVRLGLAAELVAAVADLGFDQPTAVQDKVIPLALGSDSEEGSARFIDLHPTP